MPTSTVTVLSQVSSPSPTWQAATANPQPPIVYFFQLALRAGAVTATVASRALGFLWILFASSLTSVGSAFAALSSPVLYLLSPAFLLVNILMNVFIYQPYSFLVQLMHALYPVYAFVFIAVVFAAAIGFSARLGAYLTKFVLSHMNKNRVKQPTIDSSTPYARDKSRKRVQIKEEEKPSGPSGPLN